MNREDALAILRAECVPNADLWVDEIDDPLGDWASHVPAGLLDRWDSLSRESRLTAFIMALLNRKASSLHHD